MAVIDSQVHLYEPNHASRPWAQNIAGPAHVTGEEQVAEMDRLGIDGAIVVSTYQTYRYDASYAQEVYAKYPDRFALVKPIDTRDPAVGEIVTDWSGAPGAVGIRIMLIFVKGRNPLDPGLDLALSTSARLGLPVNLFAWDHLDEARIIVERHPDTLFVIDHVGLPQPRRPEGPDVWADLPKLLALANYDNVRVKFTGACSMSAERFPFRDIWDPLAQIIDNFGIEKCMWGTDWARTSGLLNYGQGLDAFRVTERLSPSDKAMLLGGAAAKIYGWSPRRGAYAPTPARSRPDATSRSH
jgi:L-fuconolactonase